MRRRGIQNKHNCCQEMYCGQDALERSALPNVTQLMPTENNTNQHLLFNCAMTVVDFFWIPAQLKFCPLLLQHSHSANKTPESKNSDVQSCNLSMMAITLLTPSQKSYNNNTP